MVCRSRRDNSWHSIFWRFYWCFYVWCL